MEPIILASSSPRRQEILKLLNIPFQVHPSQLEESYPTDIQTDKVALYLASNKVKAVIASLPVGHEVQWILGADTTIVLDGKIYGKPDSAEEAAEFMRKFQGRTHQAITGLVLYNGSNHQCTERCSISEVSFAPMSEQEIEWYVSTGEWHGAAGGYRIQGLASCFIREIKGSESGIMGLPIFELYDILKEQNYSLLE